MAKYSTNFASDQNPLSESGSWIEGGTVGLDWHNLASVSSYVYNTQAGDTSFDDGIACLAGTWSWHQRARGTYRANGIVPNSTTAFFEVELLLHFSIAAHSATGYELTIATCPDQNYIQINRWNGALGDFTQVFSRAITGTSSESGTGAAGTTPATGDVFEFRDEGTSSNPLLVVYQNGIRLFGYDTSNGNNGGAPGPPDSVIFTAGSPGVGFYDGQGIVNASQQTTTWDRFDATDDYFDGELVQTAGNAPSSSAQSTTQAFTNNLVNGNLLVAVGWHAGTVAGTFSDTRTNSWSVIGGVTNATDVHRLDIGIAISKDAGASTVTYNHSGDAATTFRAIAVAEMRSGFSTDKSASATGNSGTPSSGASGTTTAAFELLLGTFGGSNVSGTTPTPDVAATKSFATIKDVVGGPSAKWLLSLLGRLAYTSNTFTNSATVTSQQWSALVNTLTLNAIQTQINYRFRNDDGDEATATWQAGELTNVSVANGILFRLRLQIDTTGDEPSQPLTLQYRKFGDVSWTSITTSSKFQLAASANIAAGAVTATTTQLTPPAGKTGSSFTPGKISDDTNPIAGIDVDLNFYSEFEFALKTDNTPLVGETYEFRLSGTSMVITATPQVSIVAGTTTRTAARFADLKADVTLRQPLRTTSAAPMDVLVLRATPTATHDVRLGVPGSVALDMPQTAAASAALVGTSPAMTWSVDASLALVAGSVALSGTSPAATWTAATIQIVPSALALSGTSPATTWTVPALALAPGTVALSGTAPSSTWTAASINLAISPLALSGTAPVATWSVAAIQITQEGVLSGTSPSMIWTVATIDLVQGPGGFQAVWARQSNQLMGFESKP